MLEQRFPKSAPRTTGGPRDQLKWSSNPYTNKYFALWGALKYFKWSAKQKSSGTTAPESKIKKIWNDTFFSFSRKELFSGKKCRTGQDVRKVSRINQMVHTDSGSQGALLGNWSGPVENRRLCSRRRNFRRHQSDHRSIGLRRFQFRPEV